MTQPIIDNTNPTFEVRPHYSSDLRERMGKPDQILVTMFGEATFENGRKCPWVLGMYSGKKSQINLIKNRLIAENH